RDRAGPRPPRLRRDEADRRSRRRADRPRRRAAGLVSGELLAVPNFSGGRNERVIDALEATLAAHARVLHVHFDPQHTRSALALAAEPSKLVETLVGGAAHALDLIDMRGHQGLHPHIGALDVCPAVWVADEQHAPALEVARAAGEGIAALGVP